MRTFLHTFGVDFVINDAAVRDFVDHVPNVMYLIRRLIPELLKTPSYVTICSASSSANIGVSIYELLLRVTSRDVSVHIR